MYDINDIYKAFDLVGQTSVSITFNDRTNVTEDEIRPACEDISYEDFKIVLEQITNVKPLEELRATRNAYLLQSDWIVTKSIEKGESIPQEWINYRQALRDITETYSNLNDVVWPTKPE